MLRELLMNMAITFALVATRMAAFVAVSPFPGPQVPTNIRVGVALLLAMAAAPLVMGGHHPAIGLPLLMAAIGEAMTGAAIAFVFRVGMSAAEVLGSALAHSMGLTFASSYDPTQSASSDALTRIVSNAAMLVAFAIGAHRVVIGAAVGSLRVVPVGGALDVATYAPGLLTWVARSIECGLGLAVPAMTVSIVVQVAIGLVARAAPSLQVFSVGLTVSLASGLVVVLSGFRDSLAGFAAHAMDLGHVLERVIAPAG
jgi:flagellar biosynthesis protein FliR